jgi:hypothetical protein
MIDHYCFAPVIHLQILLIQMMQLRALCPIEVNILLATFHIHDRRPTYNTETHTVITLDDQFNSEAMALIILALH